MTGRASIATLMGSKTIFFEDKKDSFKCDISNANRVFDFFFSKACFGGSVGKYVKHS